MLRTSGHALQQCDSTSARRRTEPFIDAQSIHANDHLLGQFGVQPISVCGYVYNEFELLGLATGSRPTVFARCSTQSRMEPAARYDRNETQLRAMTLTRYMLAALRKGGIVQASFPRRHPRPTLSIQPQTNTCRRANRQRMYPMLQCWI
eukprot:SAG31_NODE_23814_length_495_cov_0.651515_1_plen_148_part_10